MDAFRATVAARHEYFVAVRGQIGTCYWYLSLGRDCYEMHTLRALSDQMMAQRQSRLVSILFLTILTGSVLGFSEWLFFVTKPSFFGVFSVGQRFLALLGAAFWLATWGAISAGLLWWLLRPMANLAPGLTHTVPNIVPALLLVAACLLLVENFTQTLLGFGIRESEGVGRFFYLLIFVEGTVLSIEFCRRWTAKNTANRHRTGLVMIFAVGVGLGAAILLKDLLSQRASTAALRLPSSSMMNIAIIGGDGINAKNLSLYGYVRDTSPFLRELAGESLWARNAFSNSAHTGAAIISLLTGKLPYESGVIYSPDVLTGAHSYQSLPGLLRAQHGYRTFQATFPVYADALDLNLKNAFDEVNRRKGIEDATARFVSAILGEGTGLLLWRIGERIKARLLHVFFLKDAHNVYAEVTGKKSTATRIHDRARISDMFGFIDASAAPFFVHIHLMGTHGPRFRPRVRKYSAGQTQPERFMDDFYDDAIANFDQYLVEIYGGLAARGLHDNTIFIVYSDHGQRYQTQVRIPLLIRAPNLDRREISSVVQLRDIPRTVMSLLEIPVPSWMGGRSLVEDSLDPCHAVESMGTSKVENRSIYFDGLPSLGFLSVIVGANYYRWSLDDDVVRRFALNLDSEIPNCPEFSDTQLRDYFMQQLALFGRTPSWHRGGRKTDRR